MLMWESRESSEEPPSQSQDIDTVHESLVTLVLADPLADLAGGVDQSTLVVGDVVGRAGHHEGPEGVVAGLL